jgi:hypothetical protein
MDFRVKQKEKYYGKLVWTHVEMDDLRREQCLCLNCQRMKFCPVAAKLYELCKKEDVALAVTRCPAWEANEGATWR